MGSLTEALHKLQLHSPSEHQAEVDWGLRQKNRAEKNYRMTVELQRELKKAHKRMTDARAYATSVCVQAIVKQRLSPNCITVLAFRNMVRAMKGKNLL